MRGFSCVIRRTSTVFAVIASLFLLAATLIITYMVVKRSLGYQSIWELELSVELMVAAIFLGSPYALATGGYVSMDLLDGVLKASARRYWAQGLRVIGLLVCLYLTWEGLRLTLDAFHSGERTLGVWQPLVWPKYATMPLGMFMTALLYIAAMADAMHDRNPKEA